MSRNRAVTRFLALSLLGACAPDSPHDPDEAARDVESLILFSEPETWIPELLEWAYRNPEHDTLGPLLEAGRAELSRLVRSDDRRRFKVIAMRLVYALDHEGEVPAWARACLRDLHGGRGPTIEADGRDTERQQWQRFVRKEDRIAAAAR